MYRRRPAAAAYFGVFNIVLGALGLLVYVGGGLMALFLRAGASGGATMWDFVAVDVRLFAPMMAAHVVASAVLCLLLPIAGIGLLNLRNWGRLVSLACAAVALLLNVWSFVFQLAFVGPAMQRYIDAAPNLALRSGSAVLAGLLNFGVYGTAVVAVLYSIALLVGLLTPDVAAAFRQGEGDDDNYDDRPRRRDDDDWND